MKWNIVIGTLVLSVGLCSQSFGFELLEVTEVVVRHIALW